MTRRRNQRENAEGNGCVFPKSESKSLRVNLTYRERNVFRMAPRELSSQCVHELNQVSIAGRRRAMGHYWYAIRGASEISVKLASFAAKTEACGSGWLLLT